MPLSPGFPPSRNLFLTARAEKVRSLTSHRENFHTRLAGSRPQRTLAITRDPLSSTTIISDREFSRDFRTFPRLCPPFLHYFSHCPSPSSVAVWCGAGEISRLLVLLERVGEDGACCDRVSSETINGRGMEKSQLK